MNELATPLIDLGIRNPHYFEGRLLTAAALRADQDAHRARQRQLGRAIGAGVVEGLEVRIEDPGAGGTVPVLSVSQGLAINPKGEVLEIHKEREEVALARALKSSATEGDLFKDCQPPEQDAVPTGEGVYVLVLSPVSEFRERAPMSGLGNETKSGAGCGSRWAVEGVQLRLEPLDPLAVGDLETDVRDLLLDVLGSPAVADLSRLRSALAYLCLGRRHLRAFAADPFAVENGASAHGDYGALDDLHASGRLSDCDVPLALVYWTLTGVRFVDHWSVRREGVTAATESAWPTLSGGRGPAEARAALFQFQEHLAWLREQLPNPAIAEARDYFRFVPAGGLVPIQGPGSPSGMNADTFFSGLVSREPTEIAAAKLLPLLQESSLHGPVDLDQDVSLQTYQITENAAPGERQRYLLFTSRDLHGPLERDGVAQTLETAWVVYGGLVRRRVFQPPGTSGDALGARFTIQNALQEVRAMALHWAGLAAGRHLCTPDALAAMQQMVDVQSDLVTTFAGAIPGIDDTQDREAFATTLETFLNNAIPGGGPGLQPAITAETLLAAVAAQDAINNFVGSWTGEGVAIGFIQVTYLQSPRGIEMVPGDAEPYLHVFTVTNNTDRQLGIDLDASVSGAGVPWTGAVRLRNEVGQEVDRVVIASGGLRQVAVEVTVPVNAQIGEPALITVQAATGAPHNKADASELAVAIAEEAGEPITHSVTFEGTFGPTADQLDNLTPGSRQTFAFDLGLAASEEPFSSGFRFEVRLQADPAATVGEWQVDFGGAPREVLGSGLFGTPVTLQNGVNTRVIVRVQAPTSTAAGADKRATMVVQPIPLDLTIETPEAGPFAMRLPSSAA